MRFTVSNGPVAVKRRAANSSKALKMSLYFLTVTEELIECTLPCSVDLLELNKISADF
jgi:hypothetical protein